MSAKVKTSACIAAVVGTVYVAGAAQAGAVQPSTPQLTRAATQYLAEHGDLCMAKYTWPRDVTPADREAHSNDAVQLPVLERLGLVQSTVIAAPETGAATADAPAEGSQPSVEPARRYSLTAKGQQYYLRKKHTTLNVHGQPVEHDADFCVAHLTLDKVVKWTPPEQINGQLQTMVRYTYHVRPAEWMADPEARKVFPVADRIIRGQGDMLMAVMVRLKDGKWVPVLPGQ
jgi:hypothetical protein